MSEAIQIKEAMDKASRVIVDAVTEINNLRAENTSLRAQNAELLAACNAVEGVLMQRGPTEWFPIEVRLKVKDAIKHAEKP